MAHPEKEKKVTEIADKLSNAEGLYIADCKGLNVEEISDLRNQLREVSVEIKVVKNTLARLSAQKVGFEELSEYFKGPTAIAFCLADPINGAKVLAEFQKKHDKLGLKACMIDGQVFDESRIADIAKLPPKDQIIAQTVGMIGAPLRSMVTVLNGLLTATVIALNEIKKKKESL